jgi:hypothetical protein
MTILANQIFLKKIICQIKSNLMTQILIYLKKQKISKFYSKIHIKNNYLRLLMFNSFPINKKKYFLYLNVN